MKHRRRPRLASMPVAVAALAVAALAGACSNAPDAGSCVELRETLDPQSSTHVVAGDAVTFMSSPPTSGPHVAAAPLSGVLATTIDPLLQVATLEAGHGIVQHQGLSESETDLIGQLASVDTVVAPGEGLTHRVVATAWTWKLQCDDVDVDAITEFLTVRPSGAPGHDS